MWDECPKIQLKQLTPLAVRLEFAIVAMLPDRRFLAVRQTIYGKI